VFVETGSQHFHEPELRAIQRDDELAQAGHSRHRPVAAYTVRQPIIVVLCSAALDVTS